jgi:hypothetical protein
MDFKEIVSVSKLSGLFQIHKQRADGLIVKSLNDDKIVFAASRAHTFTPLENITIYTHDEPLELINVLLKMKEYKVTNSIPDAKVSSDELKSFFSIIAPSYDTERVYVSDIQKIIKWFVILDAKDAIHPITKATESKVEEVVTEEIADAAPAPAPKKAKATKKKKTEE